MFTDGPKYLVVKWTSLSKQTPRPQCNTTKKQNKMELVVYFKVQSIYCILDE